MKYVIEVKTQLTDKANLLDMSLMWDVVQEMTGGKPMTKRTAEMVRNALKEQFPGMRFSAVQVK